MNSPHDAPPGCAEPDLRFDVTVQVPADCDLDLVLKRLIDTRAMVPDKAVRKLGAAGLAVTVMAAESSEATQDAARGAQAVASAAIGSTATVPAPRPERPNKEARLARQARQARQAKRALAQAMAKAKTRPAAAAPESDEQTSAPVALAEAGVLEALRPEPLVCTPMLTQKPEPASLPDRSVRPLTKPVAEALPRPLPSWAKPALPQPAPPPEPIGEPAAAAVSAPPSRAKPRRDAPVNRRAAADANAHKVVGAPWAATFVLAGLAFAAGWWAPRLLRDPLGTERAMAASAWSAQGVNHAEQIDTLLTRLGEAVSPDMAPAAGASAVPASQLKGGLPGGAAKPGANATQVRRPPLPDAARVHWLGAFAAGLSEIGQGERAAEALTALAPWRNGSDPALSATVRRAELLVQAWDLQRLGQAPVRTRVEALNSSALALTDPADRADTLGDVAAVLARHASLPAALAQSFLSQAEGALKVIADSARRTASTNRWAVNQGEVLLAEVRREARAGQNASAKAVADRLARLSTAGLSETAVAHLLALRVRAERMVGTSASTRTALTTAIQRAEKLADPVAQARALRVMAQDMEPADAAALGAAVTRATARIDALAGQARADALTELSLLWADAGQTDALVLLTAHALQSPGLAPEISRQLGVDLLVGGELAQALAHHRAGEFAQADAGLRAVASQLL